MACPNAMKPSQYAPLVLESFPKRPRMQSEASRFGGYVTYYSFIL